MVVGIRIVFTCTANHVRATQNGRSKRSSVKSPTKDLQIDKHSCSSSWAEVDLEQAWMNTFCLFYFVRLQSPSLSLTFPLQRKLMGPYWIGKASATISFGLHKMWRRWQGFRLGISWVPTMQTPARTSHNINEKEMGWWDNWPCTKKHLTILNWYHLQGSPRKTIQRCVVTFWLSTSPF